MPWSDWQEGDTATINWVDLGRGLRNIGQDETGDWRRFVRTDPRVELNVYASAISAPELFPDSPVHEQLNGAFFTLPTTWKQNRVGIPQLLQTLEPGVDYDTRPDWDGGPTGPSGGRYVQYETTDDNTPVTLTGPDLFFVSGTKGGGTDTSTPGDGHWSIGVVAGAVAPFAAAFPDTSWYPGGMWPGLGSVFATGDDGTAAGTNFKSLFPNSAAVEDMFVSIRMTGAAPIAGNAEEARFSIGVPKLTYQMPRWRYWIPEPAKKPPLRLRQRDDNLFLNAGRIRNRSSRQTTNRQRSYD